MQFIYLTCKNGKQSIKLSIGSKIYGVIHITDLDKPCAYVPYLHVRSKYQNKGHGKCLLGIAVLRAKKHGCKAISLYVDTTNSDAIRFYYRWGFFIALQTTSKKNLKSHYLMTRQIT